MLPRPQGDFPRLPMFDLGSLSRLPAFPGCYRIICVTWGRVYVGSSVSLPKRFLEHCQLLRRQMHPNTWLQRAFDRCGPLAFRFQVLEVYHGRWRPDCLSPAEQRWMDRHDKLFNVRPAGSDAWLQARRGVRRDLLGRPRRKPGYRNQPLSARAKEKGPSRRPGRKPGPGKHAG